VRFQLERKERKILKEEIIVTFHYHHFFRVFFSIKSKRNENSGKVGKTFRFSQEGHSDK